jgi:glycosyltransferase involved in cell wall biosynthesis
MPVPLRLDYVSPLPPVRSGIADYSVDLLPHLAAKADVRLIHLTGQPVSPEIAALWTMVPATETGADASGPRLPLYQMGNNRYHAEVRELALRLPGVLTLHDVVLHHLLLDVTMGEDDFLPYLFQLAHDHGWIGEAAAMAKRWHAYGDAPVFSLPAHRRILLGQRGVLVHSAWAAGIVREGCPEARVRAIPMGVPLPPAADTPEGIAAGRELRQRLGLPLDVPVLGSFGFQTPIKRTETAIAALSMPGLERVHLLIVGQVAQVLDLEGEARRWGVADRVHVTGFLPYSDFEGAIAATDLCLNLRYPTAGETSASLLRVLAAGRPAVVSDYAQFAELPGEMAIKVPLAPRREDEAAGLAALLRQLLASPERLKAMGEAAREHVRLHHDPERSAEAVLAACREWESLPPPGGEERAVLPPPSSIAWGELRGQIEVAGAEAPWPEGERRQIGIRLVNQSFARWLAGSRGPGGMAVVVKLLVGTEDDPYDYLGKTGRWLSLPHDLDPGEEIRFTTELRRPLGPARLHVEPHLFNGGRTSLLGGPSWERDL